MLPSFRFRFGLLIIFALFACASVFVTPALAQDKRYTENGPDLSLRSEARVDPSTLGMSVEIPLAGAPGRAGTNASSAIRYQSKQWRMKYGGGWQSYTMYHTKAWPTYSENAAAGWTSSLDVPWIEYTGRDQRYDEYGFPLSDDPQVESPEACYIFRIHLHLADGSSHELRQSDTPQCVWWPDTTPNFNGTFYSTDGSRMRFDSDAGVLYLPDGGRYLFAGQAQPRYINLEHDTRWASQYIDRNGNTINYSSSGVTDTLGRPYDNPLANNPIAGDQIYTVPGLGGQNITYTLRWKNLGDVLSAGTLSYTSNYQCLGPNQYQAVSPYLYTTSSFTHICAGNAVFNPVVLAEVVLPNSQSYQFTYNVYGEIDRITYPTGGYERFRYDHVTPLGDRNVYYGQANRGVVERWVSANGTDEAHWTYAADAANTPYKATMTAPDGTRNEHLLYTNNGAVASFGFDNPLTGMAYEERVYNSSSQMLRRSLTEWQVSGPQSGGAAAAKRDPRVIRSVSLLLDTGGNALAASTTMDYDGDLNVISTNHYDYASVDSTTAQTGAISSIPLGTLARTEETTYLVNDPDIDAGTRTAYRNRQLFGLPTSARVKNSSGSIVAQSSISYDEASYPLLTYGSVTSWIDPQTPYRGNPTTVSHWLNTSGSYLPTHIQYDQCGSVRNSWDAKGNQSQIEYSSSYYYAYPTLTTSPDPDGSGPATALVSTSVYDLTSGVVTSTTDANNKTTTPEYATVDALGNSNPMQRLTRVNQPDGGWTAYGYSDQPGNLFVLTRGALDSSRSIEATKYFDGLGRGWRSAQSEGTTSILADVQYDSMGHVWKTSNPYRAGETVVWTTTAYDSLSRVLTMTTPDNAVVSTAYSGNSVTVTDQTGKQRQSVSDALGRLAQVYEAPNDSSFNYLTTYDYDALDNLTTVTQGSQTPRSFVYDSLKRLTSASNPESGTVCYGTVVNGQCQANGYDANGNPVYKTDARGILTTYGYDALNRVTSRSYSDGTPTITSTYDTATNGKGRLASVSSSVATYNYSSYDAMGRVLSGSQAISNQSYPLSYDYDLAGHVKTMHYPSGHIVSYGFDNAGRLNDFNGYLGDGAFRSYSTGITYSPFGGMSQEQFGTQTPVYNKLYYNSRGQLSEIREGTEPNNTSWNRGAIINHYSNQGGCWGASCSATDNNGNLMRQEYFIPLVDVPQPGNGQFTIETQQFEYDALNRIHSVNEYSSWRQQYTYDRFGNRTIDQANTTNGIPKPNFGVDVTTNRLTAPAGSTITYDAAGNLTYDSSNGSQGDRVYDAENRMTAARGGMSATWQYYTYDGEGKRIRRNINTVETWQVYGIGGEPVAEYAANASPLSPQKEYGYRNGQLLITAAVTTSWGAPPVLHDNPLVVNETSVQSRHISELRDAINALRSHLGMSAYSWTTSATTSDWISADPIIEMRIALDQALGAPSPSYAAGLAHGQSILAVHIQELRIRVLAAWVNSNSTDFRWLVADQLGTPRMIFDQTGAFDHVSRHDYLPFGEELFAGTGGRTTAQGYSASDGVRQHFSQKERDNETGLDYFGARYYASMQGRFTGADAFWKDSHVADPQSWNKYAYARNNPLKYVDPSGEKADVEIETDEKHKTGTIKIKASFAIWTGKNGVSAKQLERAKDTIKARIEKVWSGSYQQNGITYTVSTTVDVQVKGSESEATNTGAQNVVEITNGAVGDGADSVTGGHLWGPDTGRWNYGNLSDTAAHEFGHLLGVDDHDGLVLMNTNHLNDPLIPHAAATAYDYGWALGGAINSHRSESRSYVSNGDSQETRSSPMFRLGPPENHRSNTELRAGRLWWN